jgi:hypothetical protein
MYFFPLSLPRIKWRGCIEAGSMSVAEAAIVALSSSRGRRSEHLKFRLNLLPRLHVWQHYRKVTRHSSRQMPHKQTKPESGSLLANDLPISGLPPQTLPALSPIPSRRASSRLGWEVRRHTAQSAADIDPRRATFIKPSLTSVRTRMLSSHLTRAVEGLSN